MLALSIRAAGDGRLAGVGDWQRAAAVQRAGALVEALVVPFVITVTHRGRRGGMDRWLNATVLTNVAAKPARTRLYVLRLAVSLGLRARSGVVPGRWRGGLAAR